MRTAVEKILEAILVPHGFSLKVSKQAREFVREKDGLLEVVGTRQSRKVSGQTAVYFSVEGGNFTEARIHELSHIAPFKNTWWWSKESSEAEWHALRQQLSHIVLPYFFSHEVDVDEAQIKLDIHRGFESLKEIMPAFSRVNDSYWRKRGALIDIIDIEFLGDTRFAFFYVSVWHQALDGSEPICGPDDVSRVASQSLGLKAVDAVACTSLFYLGSPYEGMLTPQYEAIVSVALGHFEKVLNPIDVWTQIRPEYRHMFQMPT